MGLSGPGAAAAPRGVAPHRRPLPRAPGSSPTWRAHARGAGHAGRGGCAPRPSGASAPAQNLAGASRVVWVQRRMDWVAQARERLRQQAHLQLAVSGTRTSAARPRRCPLPDPFRSLAASRATDLCPCLRQLAAAGAGRSRQLSPPEGSVPRSQAAPIWHAWVPGRGVLRAQVPPPGSNKRGRRCGWLPCKLRLLRPAWSSSTSNPRTNFFEG